MCDDFFDEFDWEELGMAGALAEEMLEEEKEKRRLEEETDIPDPLQNFDDEDIIP